MQGYELIDSGDEAKLERFGDKVLLRPSSVAVWRRNAGKDRWLQADAIYDSERRWTIRGQHFEKWELGFGANLKLLLRLQNNGQIGLFPDHLSYFPKLERSVDELSRALDRPLKVLNLFAYTGAATVLCLAKGCEVTHVDLAKKCLDWAKQNITHNQLAEKKFRLIPEDAITFLQREKRRGNLYDLIVADPPSFSRPSKTDSWHVDKILSEMIELSSEILSPDRGSFFITSHRTGIRPEIVYNLVLDYFGKRPKLHLESELLGLVEGEKTGRTLPAGVLVSGNY